MVWGVGDYAVEVTAASAMRLSCSRIDVHFVTLSYGENFLKSKEEFERVSSIHAEDNAIRKLPNLTGRRFKKVDIMVIRVNKGGNLANSKPCMNCVQIMSTRLPAKGYNLCDVYYSTCQGGMQVSTISSLLTDKDIHVSKYHRERMKRQVLNGL